MGNPRSTRRRLRTTLLALLAGLLLAEGGVRLLLPHETETRLLARQLEQVSLDSVTRPSADPALYFELRPGLDLVVDGARVVTDALGCRVPATPAPPRPPGAGAPLRLAVLGASTSYGFRLPYELSYPPQLAARLEGALGRPVELRNFATPAWNAEQQARDFETRVLAWRPDLVLWHYDHRDAFPMLLPGQPLSLPPDFGDNLLHSAALKLLLRRLHERALRSRAHDGSGHASVDHYFTAGPLYERHLDALRRVGEQARARALPVALVIFDAFLKPDDSALAHFDGLHRELVPRLQACGFEVLDLFEPLRAQMLGAGWSDLSPFWISRQPLDGHPNAAGHAWLAATLAPWLARVAR